MNKSPKNSAEKINLESALETLKRKFIIKDIESFKKICIDNQEIAEKRLKELENEIKGYPDFSDSIKGRVTIDSFVNDYTHYSFYHTTLIYHSLFISIFSYFEIELKFLCNLAQKLYNPKIKLEDLKGKSEIDRYRKYLELIINLESASNKLKIWGTINHFQKLRNLIVHNNNNVIKDKSKPIESQELYNYINNETEISFDKKNGNFNIEKPSYINKFCENIKDYLCNLIDELKKQKISHNKPV